MLCQRDCHPHTVAIASTMLMSLKPVKAPTLIFSARDDGFGIYVSARYSAGRIPGARFVGFQQCGHTWVGHNDAGMTEILKLLVTVGSPMTIILHFKRRPVLAEPGTVKQ